MSNINNYRKRNINNKFVSANFTKINIPIFYYIMNPKKDNNNK